MNYRKPLLIVALNLLLLIGLALFLPELTIMPGKPIPAHEAIGDDCFACHTPFLGSTPEKCIGCHKVAEIGLKTTQGEAIDGEPNKVAFHQNLIEQDCVACHSDHKGVMAFQPIHGFSHELVSAMVRDRCEGCHNRPLDKLHRKLNGSCNECHDQQTWTSARFNHEEYFRFDQHHDTDCETCHRDSDYDRYTCYGCHEHSRSRIRAEHYEEGIRDFENCAECHRSGDEHEAEYRWRSRNRSDGYRGEAYEREEHEWGYRRRDDD
ncbi:MAG: class III cytochrome C family protein [Candidatus Thiodiazotropha sp.]